MNLFALILFLIMAVVFAVYFYNKSSELDSAMSVQSNKLAEYEEENKALKSRYKELNEEYDKLNEELENLSDSVKEKTDIENQIKELEKELRELTGNVLIKTINISDYDNITSEECKNKLVMLRNEYDEKVKDLDLISYVYSERDKTNKNNIKQILLCFEAECKNIIDNLTLKNADTARGKIRRAFKKINTIFSTDEVQLEPEALEYKLEELTLVYAALKKKEEEREEQKAIREQMLEEEKVRREIEKEKAKIEKEEKQFKNEISKLMSYMQKADDIEKQLYIDKIKDLEERLKAVEKDKENVLDREKNTRAGFVYIISNIGSFGDDVYKIGMTRRLEPMDRIKELGDASVPFEFDVHAMIFSEDAPALENTLHTKFRDCQVNKVNPRKEFFKVSLDEIEKVVKSEYNATVTFTKVAEAAQYRESLRIASSK